jgi:hypothetical protein
MIRRLINQPDAENLSTVLSEAYLSSGTEIARDQSFREKVLERIACLPHSSGMRSMLDRFSIEEAAVAANHYVARIKSTRALSEAFVWLREHREHFNSTIQAVRLNRWKEMSSIQLSELFYLTHLAAPASMLAKLAADDALYRSSGPQFEGGASYGSQAEIAFLALNRRDLTMPDAVLLTVVRTLADPKVEISLNSSLFDLSIRNFVPRGRAIAKELKIFAQRLAARLERPGSHPALSAGLDEWIGNLKRFAGKTHTSRTKKAAPASGKPRRRKKR